MFMAAAEPWCELTAWPAVIFADETHHLAFRITSDDGGKVEMNWKDQRIFSLPAGGGEGLLQLPTERGLHRGTVRLGTLESPLAVRLAEVTEAWPIARLRHGLPVDEDGVPVVLVDHRRDPNSYRRARLLVTLPRPTGDPIITGDPLKVLGSDAWQGLRGDVRPAIDARFPQNAVILALAHFESPRSILWCPGNGALYAGTWTDEVRLFSAITARCSALQIRPRLVVALPPLPVTLGWRSEALQRNQLLAAAAVAAGWSILDLAAIAGDPAQANRVSDGLYTEYPIAAAQERLRTALREELKK